MSSLTFPSPTAEVLDVERSWEECEELFLGIDAMIRSYARKVARFGFAEYDDVLQDGRVGAWQAAHTWDPDVAAFTTHAMIRVAGEIKDGLRRRDVVSRRFRWDPDDPRLGRQASLSQPTTLDGQLTLADLLVSHEPEPDYAVVEAAYLSWQVDEAQFAMRMLSGYERDVINYYFYGGLTLWQIGERMGFTESRASQIRSGALSTMWRCMCARDQLLGAG